MLTRTEEGNYEILDGQQRTTIIYLLIQYIRFKYGERTTVADSCDFEVQSFKGFSSLLKNNFDLDSMSEADKADVLNSDDYKQIDHYIQLWHDIEDSHKLDKISDAESFLNNLYRSEFNVIIRTDSAEEGIANFLDVNLKGVKLDTEDIFKGYLCAQDDTEAIHDIWSRLKKLDAQINTTNEGKERTIYPFMTIIEHYFRCKLLDNNLYKDIEYSSEFKLSQEQVVEDETYSEDTHLIAVIKNKTFLRNCLCEIEKIMIFFSGMVNSTGTSLEYSQFIQDYNSRRSSSKDKIQDHERDIMFNLTKKILLDSDKAPNCLLMRYLIDAYLNSSVSKDEIRRIYTVSTAGLVFSLYAKKKDLDVIKRMIKPDEWTRRMLDYIRQTLSESATTKVIRIKYNTKDEDVPQNFRCKTLATIIDYYDINSDGISVKAGKMEDLNNFLNNDSEYSLEHFIVNDSGKIEIETPNGLSFTYKYPKAIKGYKNSLCNYIFVSSSLNGELENASISEKCDRLLEGDLKTDFDNEKSDFSKTAVSHAKECFHFPELTMCGDEAAARAEIDGYYEKLFENDMLRFMKEMMENLMKKVGNMA